MIFNNPLADRKAKTGAMGFAMRGERLEQVPGNLRGNARPGIFDFRHHLGWTAPKTQNDLAPGRHGIGGVMDEIVEDPAEPFRIEQQLDRRRRLFKLQRGRLELRFWSKLLQ